VEAEAKIGNYRLRCNEQWKLKSEGSGHAYMTQDMEKEPILHKGYDKMIPRHVYDKPFTIRVPDRSEWKKGFQPVRKGGLIWYTYGSKTKRGTGAEVYCHGTGRKLSFNLGQYTTVFQAEVYAMKSRAVENLDRSYSNINIYVLSDSQAAIKALGKYQITSKLVWDCHQSPIQLVRHNRVHEGIGGNETADLLYVRVIGLTVITTNILGQCFYD
jgi:hypothetical protein